MLAKGEDPCLYTKSAKLIYIIRERERERERERSIAVSKNMRRKDVIW